MSVEEMLWKLLISLLITLATKLLTYLSTAEAGGKSVPDNGM